MLELSNETVLIRCAQVGYHNEHHDFPSVPWARLPALRQLAKEFYEPLPSHTSWPYVTWKFITDPSIGMWCRAKRTQSGERLDSAVWSESQSSGSDGGSDRESIEDARLDQQVVERGYGSDGE